LASSISTWLSRAGGRSTTTAVSRDTSYRQKRRRLVRRLETSIAQPFENQIGVRIIAASNLRYQNTRHARLTDDPTLLIVTP